MVSPVKPTTESLAHAKKVYGYECALCHGPTGNGKGDVATQMNLTLKDWTDPASLKDMTDGELYYIILKGRRKHDRRKGPGEPRGDVEHGSALIRAYGRSLLAPRASAAFRLTPVVGRLHPQLTSQHQPRQHCGADRKDAAHAGMVGQDAGEQQSANLRSKEPLTSIVEPTRPINSAGVSSCISVCDGTDDACASKLDPGSIRRS